MSREQPFYRILPSRMEHVYLTSGKRGGRVKSSNGQTHAVTRARHFLSRSAGEPLPRELALAANARYGFDFSRVRVHSDAAAVASARAVGARAYALADRVVFNDREYRPSSAAGRALLDHEVAHVAQWKAGGSHKPDSPVRASTPVAPCEAEASRAEQQPVTPAPLQTPLLQRKPISRDGPALWGSYHIDLKPDDQQPRRAHAEITFTPDPSGPPSDEISFIQIANAGALGNALTALRSDQRDIENYTTTSDPAAGVKGGYHVDIDPAGKRPRAQPTDPIISPEYPHLKAQASQPKPIQVGGLSLSGGGPLGPQRGHNRPGDSAPVTMTDTPGGGPVSADFEFESVAYAKDHPFGYGTVSWGFHYDPFPASRAPHITNEHATFEKRLSPTFAAAMRAFQQFYKS